MSGRRILLVEDEAVTRDLLARGLTRAGHSVSVASDGAQAASQLDTPFDVVVTDLLMPVADGLSLLEEMNRREHPAQRVVITSFADKERVIAVLNLGADYLLEKPFGVDALCAVLARLEPVANAGSDRSQAPFTRFFQRRLEGLSLAPREREIVECVLRGDSNKQIALKLGLSEQTVKNTLSHAYARLGVQSRGELFHTVFPV